MARIFFKPRRVWGVGEFSSSSRNTHSVCSLSYEECAKRNSPTPQTLREYSNRIGPKGCKVAVCHTSIPKRGHGSRKCDRMFGTCDNYCYLCARKDDAEFALFMQSYKCLSIGLLKILIVPEVTNI